MESQSQNSIFMYNFFKGAFFMEFSTILKELRQEKGLTQRQLAQECNLSPQCISALEKGINSPTAITLTNLSKFFNVSISELLGENFSLEEISAGASATKKISITPIEDEMLYNFREIGKRHGEQAQRALITVAEKML